MKAVSKLMTPRVVACLALASGLFGVSSLVTAGGTAQADPAWTTGFVGVGADVTQDLWAAYSGASPAPGLSQANTTFYTPLNAGSAQNFLTVSSYDANPPGQPTTTAGCIITKAGGNAWDRPNSSTEGLNALEDSVTGTLWEGSPTCTPLATAQWAARRESRLNMESPVFRRWPRTVVCLISTLAT